MPRRRGTPLHDAHGAGNGRFRTTSWTAEGISSLEASGTDVRSALEAGLRATVALAFEAEVSGSDRSTPIQGAGDDLAELFLDLTEDLLEQMAYSRFGWHDVVVDGVLRREGGGYVAWGYATEALEPAPQTTPPSLHTMPTVESTTDGIIIRAALSRSAG